MATTRDDEETVESRIQSTEDQLRTLFEQQRQLGLEFWDKVGKLEQSIERMGAELRTLKRLNAIREARERRLTPAAENHPRAVTQRELPATTKPGGEQ
jgi:hypothetical protein